MLCSWRSRQALGVSFTSFRIALLCLSQKKKIQKAFPIHFCIESFIFFALQKSGFIHPFILMNKDYMLKTRPMVAGVSFPSPARGGGGSDASAAGWEVRHGGMVVQKRSKDSNQVPNIRVRVKYGSFVHEILLSSHASFGELKKMLAGQTGLYPKDQKLMYKDKERDSKTFLDVAGVKDGSKIVLVEDELSLERKFIESRKYSNMEKASKEIEAIGFEVDKLAKQVGCIELEINGGKKVEEKGLLKMIELLMIQLINLDAITADGEVKLQRRMEVKRVQKYIEMLDLLKIRNTSLAKVPFQQQQKLLKGPLPTFQEQRKQGMADPRLPLKVSTKWETFRT